MRVVIAAGDVRVRRALSGLLELAGYRVVGTAHAVRLVPDLDARVTPELVVLELDRRGDGQDLRVVERLVRRGRTVIVVCSGTARRAAVLASGATACLDKDDVRFPDRMAEAVRSAVDEPAPGLRQQ